MEQEVWDALHRHLKSIFSRDTAAYAETTSEDLSLHKSYPQKLSRPLKTDEH
jgi:hypothetical protein